MTPWCPANKLEWYTAIILPAHTSGTALFFSEIILNSYESNKMYYSANVSTLLTAALELGNLFCTKYSKCP